MRSRIFTPQFAVIVHGAAGLLLLDPSPFQRSRSLAAMLLTIDLLVGLLVLLQIAGFSIVRRSMRVFVPIYIFALSGTVSVLVNTEIKMLEYLAELVRLSITAVFIGLGICFANLYQRDRKLVGIKLLLTVGFLVNCRALLDAWEAIFLGSARSATQFWWYSLFSFAALLGLFSSRQALAAVGRRWALAALVMTIVPVFIMIGGQFRAGIAILPVVYVMVRPKRISGGRLRALRLTGTAGFLLLGPRLASWILNSRGSSLNSRRLDEVSQSIELLNSGSPAQLAFGNGFGSSLVDGQTSFVQSETIHNSFVGALEQAGIVGLIAYVYFVVVAGIVAWRVVRRSGTASSVAMGAVVIVGLLLSVFFSVVWGEPVWAFALGYCVTMDPASREHVSEQSPTTLLQG